MNVTGRLAEECTRVLNQSNKKLKSDSSSSSGGIINGILVEDQNGTRNLIHAHELSTFTRLEVCKFEQTQRMQFENSLFVL